MVRWPLRNVKIGHLGSFNCKLPSATLRIWDSALIGFLAAEEAFEHVGVPEVVAGVAVFHGRGVGDVGEQVEGLVVPAELEGGFDAAGLAMTALQKGDVKVDLAPEDKKWRPRVRVELMLPQALASGVAEIRLSAVDHVGAQHAAGGVDRQAALGVEQRAGDLDRVQRRDERGAGERGIARYCFAIAPLSRFYRAPIAPPGISTRLLYGLEDATHGSCRTGLRRQ